MKAPSRSLACLACIAFAASSLGADCSTPTGLTRTCSGSKVQSLKFAVAGSCGGSGVVELSVPTADQCTITVLEASGPSGPQLPTTGIFGSAAGATGYDLAKGNWTLQPMTSGTVGDQTSGLDCTASPATSTGDIELTCNITTCSTVGEDLEPTCAVSGECSVHMSPASLDAAITSPPLDAGTDGTVKTVPDAGASKDAASQ